MSRRTQHKPSFSTWTIILLVILLLVAPLALFSFIGSKNDSQYPPGEDLGTVIGVDLGETRSCVGVMQNGSFNIIAKIDGGRAKPTPDGDVDIMAKIEGGPAKPSMEAGPTTSRWTFTDIVNIVGWKWAFNDDPAYAVSSPFSMTEDEKAALAGTAGVLNKLGDIAETHIGEKVKNAVVTVPDQFNDAQRQAVKDAATLAGLNVVRLVNRSAAAGIAYKLDEQNEYEERNVIVYDLGTSRLDVSHLVVDNGVFEILALAGDAQLGGEFFNQGVVTYLSKKYNQENNVDIRDSPDTIGALEREVGKAVETLITQMDALIKINDFHNGNDFDETLTREKFEELNMDQFKRALDPISQVLEESRIPRGSIDDIVLIGNSTNIPKVQSVLEGFFIGKNLTRGIAPDEMVAVGAAIQASILQSEDIVYGCPMLSVNPLSLGVEAAGGLMRKIIPRGTNYPTTKTALFTTTHDNQSTATFSIYEGERLLTKHNLLLGNLTLHNIPSAPRGSLRMTVQASIDAGDNLEIVVHEPRSGSSERLAVNIHRPWFDEEPDKMIAEEEEFREADKEAVARILNSFNERRAVAEAVVEVEENDQNRKRSEL